MTGSTAARTGPPSAAQPFILAMDHCGSFGRTLFGVHVTPTAAQLAGMRGAKELMCPGARQLAAWMTQSLLAEVDALRTGQ